MKSRSRPDGWGQHPRPQNCLWLTRRSIYWRTRYRTFLPVLDERMISKTTYKSAFRNYPVSERNSMDSFGSRSLISGSEVQYLVHQNIVECFLASNEVSLQNKRMRSTSASTEMPSDLLTQVSPSLPTEVFELSSFARTSVGSFRGISVVVDVVIRHPSGLERDFIRGTLQASHHIFKGWDVWLLFGLGRADDYLRSTVGMFLLHSFRGRDVWPLFGSRTE